MVNSTETIALTQSSGEKVVFDDASMTPLWTRVKRFVRRDGLMLLILIGMVLGFAIGFGIRELNPSKDALMWIGMPGELFMRMLRLLILPLIVSSVISGTSSLDAKSNGKISITALVYIVVTNALGSAVGVILCVLIQPGVGTISDEHVNATEIMETQDIFADLLRNIFPDNMVEASFKQAHTVYSREIIHTARNTTNGTVLDSLVVVSKTTGKVNGVNVIGLIVISTALGVAAKSTKHTSRVFITFFTGFTEIIFTVLTKLFWFAPVGISSLVTVAIAEISDVSEAFSRLGLYVLTVCVGLLIYSFAVLPAILFVLTRRNPVKFLVSIIRPCLVTFATSSSAVAIPDMCIACEERNHIDKRVTRFIIPLCATLNRDGSALYITTSAVFIGQMVLGTVSLSDAFVIWILTSVASLAIPPVPSTSIVTLVIVLMSLGIPAEGISLLFAVEWFLDCVRSACNVISHTTCAAVTFQYCKEDLAEVDSAATPPDGEIV